jgi:hypothetical protein
MTHHPLQVAARLFTTLLVVGTYLAAFGGVIAQYQHAA